jgi:hypothetical protein
VGLGRNPGMQRKTACLGNRFIASVWTDREVIGEWKRKYPSQDMLGMDASVWNKDENTLSYEVGCVGWDRKKYTDCIKD